MTSDPFQVLAEISTAQQPKHRKCEALSGKTPDQIKVLAQHYYSRARHAESRFEKARDALSAATKEIDRLRGLAHEMAEARHD